MQISTRNYDYSKLMAQRSYQQYGNSIANKTEAAKQTEKITTQLTGNQPNTTIDIN